MDAKEFQKTRELCINNAKKKLQENTNEDTLIVQAVSCIEELDKIINQVVTRVREWYSWYNPEFSRQLSNNEKFVELIVKKDKKTLLKEINVKESMGKDLKKEDVDAIIKLAKQANELIKVQESEREYLERILEKHCPNTLIVLGDTLTAKLIRHCGSLEKLAMTPAPVIQIMGAEKALFKHLSKKGKSPKYGVLAVHPLISKVSRRNKGKMARAVADKAAIAIKIDFFKGEPVGEKFRKELEKKAKTFI